MICTLELLWFFTRVFFGFDLFRYSLLFFGFQYRCFCVTAPTERVRSAGRAHVAPHRRPDLTSRSPCHASPSLRLRVSYRPTTRAHVRLLGPCFKTGREGGRRDHGPRARQRRTARPGGRRDADTANSIRRRAEPAGRRRPPTPVRERARHPFPRSDAGPRRPRAVTPPHEAEATFARRFWPTSNRSWPAPDASALGRRACFAGGGA